MTYNAVPWRASSSTTHLVGGGPFGGSYLSSKAGVAGNGITSTKTDINGDLTVEFWVHYNPSRADWCGFFGTWTPASNTNGYISFMYGATYTICSCGGQEIFAPSVTTRWADGLAIGWHHVAIVRSGTAWVCYIDGVGELFSTVVDNATISLYGAGQSLNNDTAYYANTRWTYGLRISSMARYTANFTPPTAPFNISTDTYASSVQSQPVFGQSYDSFDSTHRSLWAVNGLVSLDSTTAKFGTQSMLFDGSTGYLTTPQSVDFAWDGSSYTIDLWINPKAGMAGAFFSAPVWDGSNVLPLALFLSSNGTSTGTTGLVLGAGNYSGSTWNNITDGTTAVVANTWNHVEFGYNFATTTAYLFLNGVLLHSGTWTQTPIDWTQTAHWTLGRSYQSTAGSFFLGWMQELCVTKGVCRDTAAFTPPTAPYNLSTDTYASDIVCLVHGTQLPVVSIQPFFMLDVVQPYGGNFSTTSLSLISTPYQTSKTWATPAGVASLDAASVNSQRGNVRYIQDTDDNRTSQQIQMDPIASGGFINGICVVQGNPLSNVTVELARNTDYQVIARAYTDSSGLFTFHDLQLDVELGFYLLAGNPDPAVLNENAQVYKALDATPYAITTTGRFTYTTGTTTVASTVAIVGNAGPFTVSVASGTVPAGCTIGVTGRNITISAPTSAISTDYIFSLLITGSIRNYNSTIQFEMTPADVTPMSYSVGKDGSILKSSKIPYLMISMNFNNIASPTDFTADITAMPDFSATGSPSKSTTQYKVGDSSLALNGSTQFLTSTSAITFPTGEVTIEGWIWITTLKNYNTWFDATNNDAFQMSVNASGNYYFWDGSGAALTGTTTLAISTWYHIALTRDSANNLTFWLNGALDGSAVYSGALNTYRTSDTINIGKASSANYFGGYLNAVRLWNKCIYTAPFTPSTTPGPYRPNLIIPLYP